VRDTLKKKKKKSRKRQNSGFRTGANKKTVLVERRDLLKEGTRGQVGSFKRISLIRERARLRKRHVGTNLGE